MADRKSSDLERNVAGPSPSKQSKGKKSVVLQELIQETKEKNASMISVDAMRDLLDDQMEEMHGLFVAHFQKNKRMLDKLEQDQKVKEFELNTLRNQLMTLGSPSKQVGRGAGLDRAQLETAKKLLVQRDAACRLAEQENFQLREQLAAMQAAGNHSMLKKSADGVFAPDPVSPLPPSTADSVLHRIERAQTVLQTWASNHHPRIKLAEYVDSDDEDMDLPGAVPTNRKGETKALPDEKEDEEEEPIDPKAEYLRQNQKQRKKKALNSKLKALDMKSRMRDAFAEPSYIATEHYHKTGWAQYIAKSYWFEHGTMLVILLNSVWLGIDSTINSRALLFDAGPGIIFVENLLCLIFSVEIIIRFVAFKSKLQDFWFVFDFLLAFLMVLETWVIAVVLMVTGEDLFLIDTSVLRMLRLLRLTRVARIARLLRFLPEVMILVRAIGAATRSVILTVLLGLMIVYVFAIAFTQVAVDTPAGHAYFSSLPQAISSAASEIDMGMLQPLWAALAPTLGLTIFLSMLPTVLLLILSNFFTLRSEPLAQHQLQMWYFHFQAVCILFLPIVGSDFRNFAKQILQDSSPSSVLKLLADRIPLSSQFFFSFVVLQWSVACMEILRMAVLGKFLLFRAMHTEKEARDMAEPEDQEFYGMGGRFARWSLNLVIGCIFCGVWPLVTLVTLVQFLLQRVAYGYLFAFAETKKADSGGEFWSESLSQLLYSMVLFAVGMCGLLLHRSSSLIPAAVAFVGVVIAVISVWQFQTGFRWRSLPIPEVVAIDRESLSKATPNAGIYKHPALRDESEI